MGIPGLVGVHAQVVRRVRDRCLLVGCRTGLFGLQPVRWEELWERRAEKTAYFVEPLFPVGRLGAPYSRSKLGKSLLLLDIAAAKATGRPVLGCAAGDPVDIIYLDLEMTEEDLRERLTDMGYGPDADLSRLHYYLLPTLPPLDAGKGGDVLAALVERHQAVAVLIDTAGRVVQGDEDRSPTYRDVFRYTGLKLMQRASR